MEFEEIVRSLREGKYVVWKDDPGSTEELTPEYLADHAVGIVDSLGEGYDLCGQLHEEERQKLGTAATRYRISNFLRREDYVCSEDTRPEDLAGMIEQMPMSPEDKERMLKELKRG